MESNWNQAVEADSDIPQISESGSWFWRIMNKGEHVALQVSDKLLKPLTEAKYLNADNVRGIVALCAFFLRIMKS